MRQWRYAPTSSYGGPKIDEEALTVTDATVSADHKVVTLKRRRPQAEPRRLRALTAAVRRAGRHGAAEHRGVVHAQQAARATSRRSATGSTSSRTATLTGGAKFDTEHAGFTGTGFVSGIQTAGASSVKVDVNTAKAGDYRMALHYANGPNPFQGPKKMTLIVNGTSRQITLPSTGTWKTWGYYLDTVALKAGENTIELKYGAGDDGNVNLDIAAARPGGHDALRGRGGHAGRRRERADRARRATAASATSAATRTRARARRSRSTRSPTARRTSRWGYANGPNPFQGTKRVSLYVNGTFVKKVALPGHGRVAELPDADRQDRRCKAGSNDIQLSSTRATTATSTSTTWTSSRTSRSSAGPSSANDTFDGDHAGQVPLDDDPQRGRRPATPRPAASWRSRRPAVTSPAAR